MGFGEKEKFYAVPVCSSCYDSIYPQAMRNLEIRLKKLEDNRHAAGMNPSSEIKAILYDTYLLVTALSSGANMGVLQISEHYRERLGLILKDLP